MSPESNDRTISGTQPAKPYRRDRIRRDDKSHASRVEHEQSEEFAHSQQGLSQLELLERQRQQGPDLFSGCRTIQESQRPTGLLRLSLLCVPRQRAHLRHKTRFRSN